MERKEKILIEREKEIKISEELTKRRKNQFYLRLGIKKEIPLLLLILPMEAAGQGKNGFQSRCVITPSTRQTGTIKLRRVYYTILYFTILYYTILNSTTLYRNEQVVNLTRVTERFMASLLATIIGGVVDINMDMMTSTGPAEGNGLDYAVAGSSSSSASVSNTVT